MTHDCDPPEGNYTPDTPGMPADRSQERSRRPRLLSLNDLDGRTNAAKSARALIADLESDLGGSDQLSAAERELVRRSALAGAMLQDMEVKWLSGLGIEVAAYTTLANSQSRMLNMLGLRRRAKDVTPPDLKTYLARNDSEKPVDSV